jgi:hypothetical protein
MDHLLSQACGPDLILRGHQPWAPLSPSPAPRVADPMDSFASHSTVQNRIPGLR